MFICFFDYSLLSNQMEYNISKHYGINLSVGNLLEYTDNFQPSADDTLEYFNEVETKRRIVPLVYLTLLVVLGVPGNILIMFVYIVKFQRKTKHRMFVVSLAIADFLVCTFTIPFEIAQMTHEYTFYAEWVCKFGRTVNVIFTTSSALILVALSVNRYRRICHPMTGPLTSTQVLISIIGIVCVTIIFAWPESILSGIKLHDLGDNVTGFDCSNKEEYANTNYPLIYSIGTLIVYSLCMFSLITMCILVGRKILKHIKFSSQFSIPTIVVTPAKSSSSLNVTPNTSIKEFPRNKIVFVKSYIFRKGKASRVVRQRANSPMKVTRTALIVSICFIIVFIPFICIKIIAAVTEGNIMPPSPLASILLPTLARTHFVNNVLNFIIYISIDLAFRKHCKELFTSTIFKVFRFN